jgi:hypothetical protein
MASGRELGQGNQDFFGPCEMASSRQASAIWGPEKFKISRAPLALAHVMYLPASKALRTGPHRLEVHR